jgi:hypothetical protein
MAVDFFGLVFFVVVFSSVLYFGSRYLTKGPEEFAEEAGLKFRRTGFLGIGPRWQIEGMYWGRHVDLRCDYVQGWGKRTSTTLTLDLDHVQGFMLSIKLEGFGSRIARMIGRRDMESGDPVFDNKFLLESNDPVKARLLLSDPLIRDVISRNMYPLSTLKIEDGRIQFRLDSSRFINKLLGKEKLKGILDMMVEVANKV